MRPTWVYIVKCSDGSYYTGAYRGEEIETRVSEHNLGYYRNAYTAKRRPVELVWAETFQWAVDAIDFERQLKGWSRVKKEVLIQGDWEALPSLSKRGSVKSKMQSQGLVLRDALRAPQDEEKLKF